MKKLLFILAICLSAFASAQCPVGNLTQNAKWRFVFSQCMEDTLVLKYADTSQVAYIDANGNLTTITYSALLDSLDVEASLLNPEYYSGWCASGQVPSYVSNNHTAEGKLIIKGDTIFNFFRSSAGGHVNNDGKIVMRFSLDSGITWSVPSTVYDSSGIDDRNAAN